MLPGELVTVCVSTRAESTRPAPWSNGVSPAVGVAAAVRVAFSCSPLSSGCCCASSAAAPATCGVAIDVPDSDV